MLHEFHQGRAGSWSWLGSDPNRSPITLTLKGVTQVDRDPDWVFSELHRPEALLNCVPGGNLTRLIAPGWFEARIAVGLGPFNFNYCGTGRILESDPKKRTASMTLQGKAAPQAPDIRIRMSMAVDAHPRGAEIQMSFRIAISDRQGLLRRAWVDPIACDLLDRTIRRVKQQLEDIPRASGPIAV